MKHTLFLTMMAAALMGGQVFAETVYRVSDYEGESLEIAANATLIVDAQIPLSSVYADVSPCLTLDYQGDFVLTASMIDTPNVDVLNITSTVDAVKTKWEETFSAEAGGSITLCRANDGIDPERGSVQFLGTEANNTVQLGDTEVMFKGVVADLAALDMNQVGVVWGAKEMTLVGKVEKSVPEPATGTLGLLALMVLAARRRRH